MKKSNEDGSEVDTDDLLLSGVEMMSSATSLISDLEKRSSESKMTQGGQISVDNVLPQNRSVRRLNFDNFENNAKLFDDFQTSSCQTTPLIKSSKSCLKKIQSPSPLKSTAQVSFVADDDVDASSLIPIEKCQKLRALFVDVRQEFEKLSRVSHFGDNTSLYVTETSSVSASGGAEEAREEINFIKNLNAQEVREVFEAEIYKRFHGEKKIRMLQKQNLDLEQRLTVANSINSRRNTCLVEVETLVDDLVNELIKKDKGRQTICANLFDENVKLKDTVGQLIDYSQSLTKKYEKLNEDFRVASAKLAENENARFNLQSDNESLRFSLKTLEDSKENLMEKIRSFEADKKRAVVREEELTKELLTNEKIIKETSVGIQRLKNELNAEKSMHRSQLDEIERHNKMKLFDVSQEYEKRLSKINDELEQKKFVEIRKLKNEFDASLKLYDEKFVQTLNERDEALKKLREFERCFEDNLRMMYNMMQQRLTTKYYELVSEFSLPPTAQRPASVSGVDDKHVYFLADEFLERLQKVEPLATPRHSSNNNQSNQVVTANNNRTNSSNPESLQQFAKMFSNNKSQQPAAATNTPADPPGKL